jgi:hypothetical protein
LDAQRGYLVGVYPDESFFVYLGAHKKSVFCLRYRLGRVLAPPTRYAVPLGLHDTRLTTQPKS